MLLFPLLEAERQKLAVGLVLLTALRFLQRKTVLQRILQPVFLESSIGCAECTESGPILTIVYLRLNSRWLHPALSQSIKRQPAVSGINAFRFLALAVGFDLQDKSQRAQQKRPLKGILQPQPPYVSTRCDSVAAFARIFGILLTRKYTARWFYPLLRPGLFPWVLLAHGVICAWQRESAVKAFAVVFAFAVAGCN
ncbi:MAG TPA: hypothetical protein VI636_19025 [Candidatus Angelobacter sp.]